jgi:hypothetical protein
MLRPSLALALIAFAAPAHAADRSYVVTNFDRVRVDGPYSVQVEVGTGGAAASASGDDRALGDLDISVNGGTLTVRKGSQGWGERGKASGPPPVITLRTPAVRGAVVIGGAKLALAGTLRTTRLDLQVTGAGTIDARGVDADDVVVTVIGNGNVSLAGRTARARSPAIRNAPCAVNRSGRSNAVPGRSLRIAFYSSPNSASLPIISAGKSATPSPPAPRSRGASAPSR